MGVFMQRMEVVEKSAWVHGRDMGKQAVDVDWWLGGSNGIGSENAKGKQKHQAPTIAIKKQSSPIKTCSGS